jgi:hypothetical protein
MPSTQPQLRRLVLRLLFLIVLPELRLQINHGHLDYVRRISIVLRPARDANLSIIILSCNLSAFVQELKIPINQEKDD